MLTRWPEIAKKAAAGNQNMFWAVSYSFEKELQGKKHPHTRTTINANNFLQVSNFPRLGDDGRITAVCTVRLKVVVFCHFKTGIQILLLIGKHQSNRAPQPCQTPCVYELTQMPSSSFLTVSFSCPISASHASCVVLLSLVETNALAAFCCSRVPCSIIGAKTVFSAGWASKQSMGKKTMG